MKNTSLTQYLPADWKYSFNLDVDKVWSAFFLHGLLLDVGTGTLDVPHDGANKHRLRSALLARNIRMAGPGQDEWNHACDACTWYTTDEHGQVGMLPLCPTISPLSYSQPSYGPALQTESPSDDHAVVSTIAWNLYPQSSIASANSIKTRIACAWWRTAERKLTRAIEPVRIPSIAHLNSIISCKGRRCSSSSGASNNLKSHNHTTRFPKMTPKHRDWRALEQTRTRIS